LRKIFEQRIDENTDRLRFRRAASRAHAFPFLVRDAVDEKRNCTEGIALSQWNLASP
jgi:hypothetical protein